MSSSSKSGLALLIIQSLYVSMNGDSNLKEHTPIK
jgi:hypothetical protein